MKQLEVSEECWNTAQLNEAFECGDISGVVISKRSEDGKFYVILSEI